MRVRSIGGAVGTMLSIHRREIRILMYHRINPDRHLDDLQLSVTPENFTAQMDYLGKTGWRVVSLTEALVQIETGVIRQDKQVVLTFDDGYRDNYDYAFPVLWDRGFPATIFLVAGGCGTRPEYLDRDRLRLMREHNISYGAHTLSHPRLTDISDAQAWQEISESKDQLERLLGCRIDCFAYPSGRFHETHRQMAIRAGYKCGLGIAPGGVVEHDDPFALRRTEIAHRDSPFDFRNKLRGGFDLPHRMVQKKQGLYPAPQPHKKKAS